jgi:hypothetical protein
MSKNIEGLTIKEFKIKLHPCLNNYDINICVAGNIGIGLKEFISPYSLSLDFQGTFFKQLSQAVEKAINYTCTPLKLTPHIKKVDIEDFNEFESKFQIEMHLGMPEYLCEFTLKKFIAEMNELAEEDAVVEFTFINTNNELFSILTKPSLIIGSIERDESALFTDTIPEELRRECDEPTITKGSVFQILCIIFVWVLCINSDLVSKRFPCLFAMKGYGLEAQYSEYHDKALELSLLDNKLMDLKKQDKTEEMKPVLSKIEELFNVKNITLEEFEWIKNKFWEQEAWENSSVKQICRVFKIVWFGIVGWVLYICFNFVYAVEFFLKQIKEVRNHKPSLYGILAALVSSLIVFEGFSHKSDLGPYITTVGVVLGCILVICFYYSSLLQPLFNTYKHYILYIITLFAAFHPATAYSANKLPYLFIWFIIFQYLAILSNIISNWVYSYIGLSQKYIIERLCVDFFLLHVILIGCKILGIAVVKSFQNTVITMESFLLSICLLIVSTYDYADIETEGVDKIMYFKKQLVVILHLVSCVLGEYRLGIYGLFNIGYLFSVIYIIQKIQDFYPKVTGINRLIKIVGIVTLLVSLFYKYTF